MSGGGSSGTQKSEVTQTSTNLPAFAEPYYHDLMQRTAFTTSQPYETYGGPRVADFSPYQQEGMARMGELGMSGKNEGLSDAQRMASEVGNGIGLGDWSRYSPNAPKSADKYTANTRDSGYQANQLGPEGYYNGDSRQMGFEAGTLNDNDMIQSYMSPYMQSVVDVQKREAMRDADIRHQATGLDSARSGSLGGYREGVMRSQTERDLGTRLGDIQAEGTQAAFMNAQQAFEQDRAARAQQEQFGQSQFGMNEQIKQRMAELQQQGFSQDEAARQAQEQFAQGQFGMNEQNRQAQAQLSLDRYNAYEAAKQAAAQMGLSAAEAEMQGQIAASQIKLDASNLMANYAGQEQMMELERLGLLQGVGSEQQRLAQMGLDTGYADYLRQQAYPYEQLSFMSNIMQGNAVAPGSTQTVFGQQPSTMQQMLGAGIGGLGMYNAFQGMGGGNG